MSTLVEIAEALAAALQPLRDDIEDLQIYPYFLLNPTPPAIDIYPGDPFQSGTGFDPAEKNLFWTVRARWTTADPAASQQGLLSLLDPSGLEAALYADDTLGGVVSDIAVVDDTPTGYREYVADTAINGRLLGAEWRVHVIMSANGAAPPVVTVPAAPTLSSATAGDAAVTLAWAPHATGGTPITAYKIYRGTSAGTETLLTTVGVVTAFLDDAVTNDTTYYYKVSAVNTVGESSRSNELSATPTATLPGGPTLLDDFNRADSSTLGANWTRITAISGQRLKIASNVARDQGTGFTTADAWTADIFGVDWEAQITCGTVDSSAHIWLFGQVPDPAAGAFTGYLLDIVMTGPTVATATLYRGNTGSYTTVGTASGSFAVTAGDTFTLTKTGSVLTAKRNGAAIAGLSGVTDPAPLTADGHIGIGLNGTSVATLDDFTGGEP